MTVADSETFEFSEVGNQFQYSPTYEIVLIPPLSQPGTLFLTLPDTASLVDFSGSSLRSFDNYAGWLVSVDGAEVSGIATTSEWCYSGIDAAGPSLY